MNSPIFHNPSMKTIDLLSFCPFSSSIIFSSTVIQCSPVLICMNLERWWVDRVRFNQGTSRNWYCVFMMVFVPQTRMDIECMWWCHLFLNLVLCDARMVLDSMSCFSNQVFHHWYDGTLCDGETHSSNTYIWCSIWRLWIQQDIIHWRIERNELPNVYSEQCFCSRLSTSHVEEMILSPTRSPFKIKYNNRSETENTRKLFSTFLEELDAKYAHSEHFPICKELKYQYYEEICSWFVCW